MFYCFFCEMICLTYLLVWPSPPPIRTLYMFLQYVCKLNGFMVCIICQSYSVLPGTMFSRYNGNVEYCWYLSYMCIKSVKMSCKPVLLNCFSFYCCEYYVRAAFHIHMHASTCRLHVHKIDFYHAVNKLVNNLVPRHTM